MLYVKRDNDGHIVAISSAEEAQQGWEVCPKDDPEVLVFLDNLATESALASTDLGLARVVEDLIDLLISRDAMRFTDLPAAAQEKLLNRRSLRASLNSLRLLDDHDDNGLI